MLNERREIKDAQRIFQPLDDLGYRRDRLFNRGRPGIYDRVDCLVPIYKARNFSLMRGSARMRRRFEHRERARNPIKIGARSFNGIVQ